MGGGVPIPRAALSFVSDKRTFASSDAHNWVKRPRM
jgi:hypothetical protein